MYEKVLLSILQLQRVPEGQADEARQQALLAMAHYVFEEMVTCGFAEVRDVVALLANAVRLNDGAMAFAISLSALEANLAMPAARLLRGAVSQQHAAPLAARR